MTRTLRSLLAILLLCVPLVGARAGTASASPATYVVNVADDLDFGSCDAFHCSLREALDEANSHPGSDMIHFNIPGAGAHTIALRSENLIATDPVTIDATTQPGFAGKPLIEINGTNAVAGGTDKAEDGCITLDADASTLRGFVINRCGGSQTALAAAVRLLGVGDVVQGNYIGTDLTGEATLPNAGTGIATGAGASSDIIGGDTALERNVISGNRDGVVVAGTSLAKGSAVQGNYIGTNAEGTVALGNAQGGIRVTSRGNLIGGTGPGEGNLISGNGTLGNAASGKGIEVPGGGNRIQGNLIGTDANGTGALGNVGAGIWIEGSANRVSGGNVIAHNATGVVPVFGVRNAIRRNSIFANTGLGIDLKNDGVTPNDASDLDGTAPGDPNGLQNFPVISLAAVANGNDFIWGSLNSTASSTFLLDFFSNAACDGSGNGEGQRFLGSTVVTANASGNASFNVSFPAVATTDGFFTGTATDTVGNTSEFSACVQKKTVSDLGVTKTDSPDPAGVGKDLAYHITATNKGPNAARNVIIKDTLPTGVTFKSATPSWTTTTEGKCTISTSIVTCPDPNVLGAGASATVDIVVTPDAAGSIQNRVDVTSSSADPKKTDNTAFATTTVQRSAQWADLSVTNADSPDPYSLGRGGSLTYTLTVTNHGPNVDPTHLTLTDTLPASVDLVDVTAGPWSCSHDQPASNIIVTCVISTFDFDSSSVTIDVQPTAEGTLHNVATIRSTDQFDPNTADNTATADTSVVS
jgi:uncharacterized repeat protein (TIGR01451 family)/CSLREA domain-containing protein